MTDMPFLKRWFTGRLHRIRIVCGKERSTGASLLDWPAVMNRDESHPGQPPLKWSPSRKMRKLRLDYRSKRLRPWQDSGGKVLENDKSFWASL